MPLQIKVVDGKPSQVLRLLKRLGHNVNKRSHVKSSLLEMFEVNSTCIRVDISSTSIDLFEKSAHLVTSIKNLETLVKNKDNDG